MTHARAPRHPQRSRLILTSAVVAVALFTAVWVAPRASGAAASWLQEPPVRLQTLRGPDGARLGVARPSGRAVGAPVTLDAGARFSMAGVICDVPAAGVVTVRLRTSVDGTAWGPWLPMPLEVVDEDGSARAFTDPVWTGPARYLQVKATGDAHGPAELTGLRVVAIDPTGGAGVAARLLGAARHLAATVAALGPASPASAASTAPAIVTRSKWGADERLRSGSPSYATLKMAFVHHTASGNTYSQADAPGIVRAIYAYHTKSLGWSDIGYNFLIDRFGTIYEGRYGGVTRGVIGAQAGGFNTGSTGVAVLGTYTASAPPAAAVTSLERLLAWKLGIHGLDPNGKARLTCGLTDKYKKGTTVTFPVIAGHRQANYTECPGDAFYALLPAVRADVARRIGAAARATLGASTTLISPNGDGVLDTTDLDVAVTTAADWVLSIKDDGGRTIASWSGQSDAATVTWDGTSGSSDVPDGVYTADLSAAAAGGDTLTATTQITVDTTAPRLAESSASTAWFSPNGDRQDESVTATYTPDEACAVRVGIMDADGTVLRWLHGWRARSTRSYSATWDGRVGAGSALSDAPDGEYRFDIERRDDAGNIARRGIRVTVDRTIGFAKATPVTISPNGDRHRDRSTVGFTLTRPAAVTATIRLGDEVVRTVELGQLETGAQTFVWDGNDETGTPLSSSRPVATLTAVSSLGESSVLRGFVVDLYAPRLYATRGKATTLGHTIKTAVKIVDPFSAKADLRYKIVDKRGRRVAAAHPGYVRTGTAVTVRWRPKSRGTFTIVYRATDLGSNRERTKATTRITVR